MDISKLRNIGISAHIDSGKTTLTERILYFSGRIRKMHEVKGSDGVGATMDSMELERERGITIASAATHCSWAGHDINIIDTPGHVDFTIEVERSLRVLDGAILALCAVAGVQSQSHTVDRQMRRYGVPRLAFFNKCDRVGADPIRVRDQLREKLGLNPVLLQLPLGMEEKHRGIIDLIEMQAVTFEGQAGEQVVRGPVPDELVSQAEKAREEMLDLVSMFSDELTEALLTDQVTSATIKKAIREATIKLQIVPVLMGSAYKNKGVQPLMDAAVDFLPAPDEITNNAIDLENDEQDYTLISSPDKPTVALAFKLEDSRYGQLTYLRVYQGSLKRDDNIYNVRTGKKVRLSRLVRMHADKMENIVQASAGDIVALFGIDCSSGDTFTDGKLSVLLTSMHIPEPVIALSVKANDQQNEVGLSKALRRFSKEDPTFKASVDSESGETIIQGMGELHLDVYLERMRREYGVQLTTSAPQVAYRETITKSVEFDYTHKKQTGGSGQYGRVAGRLEPMGDGDFEFVDNIYGGAIPTQYIPSVKKGFEAMQREGPLVGAPLVQVRVVLEDGKSHAVDSSDMAFQEAAKGAWREVVSRAAPQVLEPIMRVTVEGPSEFVGSIMASLTKRRALIIGSQEQFEQSRIEADAPLAEMFGYATVLRSATEGKAEFSMEFLRYQQVPVAVKDELVERKKTNDTKKLGR
jgi:elongation factor G